MSRPIKASESDSCLVQLSAFPGDVTPLDLPALRDLVRFGVMADDQLARRYEDSRFGLDRLEKLKEAGVIKRWWEPLEGTRIYEPERLARVIAPVRGAQKRSVYDRHLVHDIALVDLADHLAADDPTQRFLAESEVRAFLGEIAPPPRRMRGDTRHRPDGLLVGDDSRIAIELELTPKDQSRYEKISGWFVRELRVHRVRWYISKPRILERLREVNAQHGFDHDMGIELLPLPPGVRIRERQGRYEA
jgi:hypothetical protein